MLVPIGLVVLDHDRQKELPVDLDFYRLQLFGQDVPHRPERQPVVGLATGIGECNAEVRGQIIQRLGPRQNSHESALLVGHFDLLGSGLRWVVGGDSVLGEENHHGVWSPVVPAHQIRSTEQKNSSRLHRFEQQGALLELNKLRFEGVQGALLLDHPFDQRVELGAALEIIDRDRFRGRVCGRQRHQSQRDRRPTGVVAKLSRGVL